jgi:perosamine synthetase
MTNPAVTVAVDPLVTEVVGAVRSVLGTSAVPVALHEPEFSGREWQYVRDCLDTGWVSSVGAYVDRFERELAEYTGAGYAIAMSNGTAALHICLLLAGVRGGEEVLVPTLTFVATANTVAYIGATPHFVDCEDISLGVDAARLEDYLRETAAIAGDTCINLRTGAVIRALVVMHVFGHPCDLDALDELARRWKLVLVEDAAESLGSRYRGRHTGTVGRLAALSFNGNKIVTTGGGGAMLTGDAALARRAKHITTTARTSHRWSFLHNEVGYNYRLPNINAALGCAQLERLPSMLRRKRELAGRYGRALDGLADVRFLAEPAGTNSNYWLNSMALSAGAAHLRDDLLAALNDAGYESRPVWTLMHRLPMFESCPRMDVCVACGMEASVVSLPSSAKLAGTTE